MDDKLICNICKDDFDEHVGAVYHFSGIISGKFSGHIHACAFCVDEFNIPIDLNFDTINWDIKNSNGYPIMEDKEALKDQYKVRITEILSTSFILVLMLAIFFTVFSLKNKQYESKIKHEQSVEILTLGEKFFILDSMDDEERNK